MATKKKELKNKGGRPKGAGKRGHRKKKEINFTSLKRLCKLQCTEEEIAGFFECSISALVSRVKEEYGVTFKEYFKRNSMHGKTSLRRDQFKLAKTNGSVAIFLGKQYLNQTDQIKTENTNINHNKDYIVVEQEIDENAK